MTSDVAAPGPDKIGPDKIGADKNRVIIFDTTMRDGEQSPGASMSFDEKLELAKILEEMGVDVIEAGFPIASNGDFEAVREIAKIVTESTVCGLARAGVGRHRALRRGDPAAPSAAASTPSSPPARSTATTSCA